MDAVSVVRSADDASKRGGNPPSPRRRLQLRRWLKALALLREAQKSKRRSAAAASEGQGALGAEEAPPASLSDSGEGDGTKQSRSVEKLRKKYRALLEGAPDAVLVADSDTGRILEANQAAASLLETTVQDLVGRHQSELHPSDDLERYRALFEEHKSAAERGADTRSKLEDGSQIYVESDEGKNIPVEISASFVELDGESLFVGIFRDLTDRRRRERELETAKKEAEMAHRLKTAMLTNLSHEIRTPITSIIGFSKILTQMLSGEPEEHAKRVYQAGQHLMKRINSVLEISKLEAGDPEINVRPVRLDRAAEWAVDLLRPRAENRGLTLEVRIPEEPVEVLGNLEALNHVAENFVENAIKFTPEGGRVEISVREEGEEAVLDVVDTGIGMDPDTVETLFEPFRQASEGVDREYPGTGLGLSIAQELADAIGGELEVETEKGTGSRFAIRLPRPAGDSGSS